MEGDRKGRRVMENIIGVESREKRKRKRESKRQMR